MNPRPLAGTVFSITLVYALVRYVGFNDVAWANVPIYVLNKAISWTAVILFGLSLVSHEKARRRYLGTLAAAGAMAHILMSLMVLNTGYFAKFYDESGRLNAIGELSMLAGVAAALFLGGLFTINLMGNTAGQKSLRAGWGRAVLWSAAAHVAIMGYPGWTTPGDWPGYLPPITLLSFAVALYFLYARRLRS